MYNNTSTGTAVRKSWRSGTLNDVAGMIEDVEETTILVPQILAQMVE